MNLLSSTQNNKVKVTLQKYNVVVMHGDKIILTKTVMAGSLNNACYSEGIIADLKSALNISVMNHSYNFITENRASAVFLLNNPKSGKTMFRVEVRIVS